MTRPYVYIGIEISERDPRLASRNPSTKSAQSKKVTNAEKA